MKKKVMSAIAIVAVFSCTIALADWPDGPNGGGHVMTEVQYPDTSSDAVNIMVDAFGSKPQLLADDWQASRNATVSDAHIWFSWNSTATVTEEDAYNWITGVTLAIHEDTTDGSLHEPGAELWSGDFVLSDINALDPDVSVRLDPSYANTQGGWVDPWGESTSAGTHTGIWQLNVNDLVGQLANGSTGYFQQTEGEMYWLSAVIYLLDDDNAVVPEIGWHTAADLQGTTATAVYNANGFSSTIVDWQQLDEGTNLAFVMTPEPSALGLLLLCSVSICTTRRKRTV